MMNPYTRANSWSNRLRQLGLTALLAGGATVATHAQNLNYLVSGATNVATTYTDITPNPVADTQTNKAIAVTNTDDANSAVQNIGFTFNYNGTAFTQFTLNTNGFIKLGATAPSDTKLFLSESDPAAIDVFQSPNDPNIIAPFNFDLTAGTGTPEYRVSTTGANGSQICTIQWKNVADKASTNPTQYTNLSFQVRLYQATGVIELVYAAPTVGTTSALRFSQIGLKGASFGPGQIVQGVKQSTAAWSTTTFADYTTVASTNNLNTVNFRSVAAPDAGRTFRFTPVPANPNDAAVLAVYTLGKIATPSALPHTVQAVVSNAGSAALTNLDVTLNVTGANTFTSVKRLATLAVGASTTVTFDAYPATLNLGTNSVAVTVPADNVLTNNSMTYGQTVTTNRISYTDPTGTVGGSVGVGQANGALAAKYTLPVATSISDVTLDFGVSTFATSTYQVVLYDATGTGATPGRILYTSPTQTRVAAASTPTIAIPNTQVPATFYIGIKELDNNPGLNYQTENPLRPATFYYSLDAATNWVSVNNTPLRTRLAIDFGVVAAACAGPTAVAVSNITPTTATVTFTAPTTAPASYQIVYGPAGFDPATGGTTVTATTSPVTLTGLTPSAAYQVYVRSNCTGGGNSLYTTAVSFSTACDVTAPITAFPYNQNFDSVPTGQSLPCGITVLDSNADGATWGIRNVTPNTAPNAMRYTSAIANSVAANDWFFTPPLTTVASTRYQVAFRYRGEGISGSTSPYVEKLEVKVGTAATPAGQTTTLFTNTNITNTGYALVNGTSTPVVASFVPGAGTRFVGFHVFSDATQGNLYIDDLSITTSVVTATTSENLLKAVSVFPNPSTGVFDLEIHGANAKGNLGVVVTNTLGQQVYVGTARDNYTNKLDLGGLAPGLYHLQVRNGDETLTRQIAIVK